MNILPQILDISSKNLIISNITFKFQKELYSFFEKFIYHPANFIPSSMMTLQKIMNNIIFLSSVFKSIVDYFKNSKERKKKFNINKFNIERTLITVFGELTYL